MDFAKSQVILDKIYMVENQSYVRPVTILVVDREQGTDVTFTSTAISTSDHIYMLDKYKEHFQTWLLTFEDRSEWSNKLKRGVEHIRERIDWEMHQLSAKEEPTERQPSGNIRFWDEPAEGKPPDDIDIRFHLEDVHFPINQRVNNDVNDSQPMSPEENTDPADDNMEEDEVKILMEIITIED